MRPQLSWHEFQHVGAFDARCRPVGHSVFV
jgi:hypothetical protein